MNTELNKLKPEIIEKFNYLNINDILLETYESNIDENIKVELLKYIFSFQNKPLRFPALFVDKRNNNMLRVFLKAMLFDQFINLFHAL